MAVDLDVDAGQPGAEDRLCEGVKRRRGARLGETRLSKADQQVHGRRGAGRDLWHEVGETGDLAGVEGEVKLLSPGAQGAVRRGGLVGLDFDDQGALGGAEPGKEVFKETAAKTAAAQVRVDGHVFEQSDAVQGGDMDDGEGDDLLLVLRDPEAVVGAGEHLPERVGGFALFGREGVAVEVEELRESVGVCGLEERDDGADMLRCMRVRDDLPG